MSIKDKEILNNFGKILVKEVRDTVYRHFLKAIAGEMKSPSSIKIRENLSTLSHEQLELVKEAMLSTLDSSLHYFLWMIEQENNFDLIAINNNNFTSLKGISDGLCGELHGENGWVEKYSEYPSTLI